MKEFMEKYGKFIIPAVGVGLLILVLLKKGQKNVTPAAPAPTIPEL